MTEIDDIVKERCQFCDTMLVIESPSGALMHFTKHDDEFCKIMMKGSIDMQQKIIESKNVQRAMDEYTIMQVIRKDNEERMELEDQLRRDRCISDVAMGKTPKL